MGKCVKCGRETENQYIYYTADVEDVNKTYSGNTVTTRTIYNNFEKHENFLCGKCGWLGEVISFGFVGLGGLAIAIFMTILGITGKLKGQERNGLIIFLTFLVSGFIYLFFAIRRFKAIRNDKPGNAEGGSEKLKEIMSLKGLKEKSDKTYFSITEYERLK
jgi:hypothetical protein